MLLVACIVACNDWVASSALNCAIWAIICVSSIGFIGSWFCSCAMSSFRKSCLPSFEVPVVVLGLVPVELGTWTEFRNEEELTSVIVVLDQPFTRLRRGNRCGPRRPEPRAE